MIFLGSANSNVTVTVWGTNYLYARAERHGDYFRAEVPLNNSNSSVWLSLTNLAVLNNGTNADIISTNTGNVFLQKTPETFGFDADGNLTANGRWTAAWDAENRATAFASLTNAPTASKKKVDCAYDYQGRRIQKVVSTNNGTSYVAQSTNKFVYDGWNLAAVLDATNGLVCSITWGLAADGLNIPLTLTINQGANAGTYLYCLDGSRRVSALVNATNGAVAGQWDYDPFLGIIRASGPLAKLNPLLGTGQFYDWETGLYYYGYRYFDPVTGTWLSREPNGESASLNAYAFVGNDPIDLLDILGLYGNPVTGPQGPVGPSTPYAYNPWGPSPPSTPLSPRARLVIFKVTAALQCVGGGLEMVGGAALATGGAVGTAGSLGAATPVSGPAMVGGGIFFVNGGDNFITGARNLIFSVPAKTATETAISAGLTGAGLPKATADNIASGINGGLMIGGGVASAGFRLTSCCNNPKLVVSVETQGADEATRQALLRLMHMRQLGLDPARGFIPAEAMAGIRLEQALGRTITRGADEAVDFVDTVLGPISLKGPIPTQGSVPGLANSVIRDAMGGNTATSTIVVDTLGLSDAQVASLQATVQAGTQGTSKTIIYLR
jgi:RHS repeat-associated protein